jgi:hypothetical protein
MGDDAHSSDDPLSAMSDCISPNQGLIRLAPGAIRVDPLSAMSESQVSIPKTWEKQCRGLAAPTGAACHGSDDCAVDYRKHMSSYTQTRMRYNDSKF